MGEPIVSNFGSVPVWTYSKEMHEIAMNNSRAIERIREIAQIWQSCSDDKCECHNYAQTLIKALDGEK